MCGCLPEMRWFNKENALFVGGARKGVKPFDSNDPGLKLLD